MGRHFGRNLENGIDEIWEKITGEIKVCHSVERWLREQAISFYDYEHDIKRKLKLETITLSDGNQIEVIKLTGFEKEFRTKEFGERKATLGIDREYNIYVIDKKGEHYYHVRKIEDEKAIKLIDHIFKILNK